MPSPLTKQQTLALATLLILAWSCSSESFGQESHYVDVGAVGSFRAKNPESNHPGSPRPGKGSGKVAKASPEELKRQEVDQAIKNGNLERDRNNYEQALNYYRRAEALSPESAPALYGLGNLYADFHCADASINYYVKSLKFDPNYLEARVALAYSYAKEEQYGKAEEEFAQVLAQEPNDLATRIGLGLVYAKQGKYEKGIAEINRVIGTGSSEDQAKAYFARGDVYFDEEKNWKKAVAGYEAAIKLKPDFAGAVIKLAFAQLWLSTSTLDFSRIRAGDIEEAEKLRVAAKQATDSINEVIRRGYTPPGVYADLGLALAYQRRFQEAVEHLGLYQEKIDELRKQMLCAPQVGAALCRGNCGV
jgi:tetratricopeptide (TPR) repeat protein